MLLNSYFTIYYPLDKLVFLITLPGSRACGGPGFRAGDSIPFATAGRQHRTELENSGPEAMDFLQKLHLDYRQCGSCL